MNTSQPHTWLLVEDNEDDINLMKRAIQTVGIDVVIRVVKNGQEAIDYLSGNRQYANRNLYPRPTFVFLDLKMPRMSGFDVLRWIRHTATTRRLIVIVLTSSNMPLDIVQAYELGANSYVMKPPTFSELLDFCKSVKAYWMTFNRLAEPT